MFHKTRISPSVLSADFTHLADELNAIEQAGADWVHFDVMDGHFVPNLTVGVPVLHQMRAATSLPLDVHLMISNPLVQLPWFLEASPNWVTVHYEAFSPGQELQEAQQAVSLIHDSCAYAGVALKPDTPIEVLKPMIGLWDMVLVMSVYPGFSGQHYIPESADRIAEVVRMCEAACVSPLIQVDGGINSETASLVAAHGADVLVAGNAVFKADNYSQAIQDIRQAAEAVRAV